MSHEAKDGARESSDVQREVHPKHTPGPWALGYDDGYGTRIVGPVPVSKAASIEERVYCSSIALAWQRDQHPRYGGGISHETARANARLISLAPELLAALKSVEDALAQVALRGTTQERALLAVRAAIARAEGRS